MRNLVVQRMMPGWIPLSLALATSSCDTETVTEAYTAIKVGDIASMIAPGANVPLNADRQFILEVPTSRLPTISPSRASELATTYLANAIGDNRALWQDQCSCALKAEALTPQRTYYGHSPVAAHEIPSVERNMYGPYYLVLFGEGEGRPVLAVAVSAFAVYLEIADDRVQWPGYGSTEFRTMGIPPEYVSGRPDSPEAAATRVTHATGALISSSPRLVQAGYPYAPQVARWEIRLDRRVTVANTNGELSQVSALWVDWRGDIVRPIDNDSGDIIAQYLDRSDNQTKQMRVSRVEHVAFEPALLR